MAPGNACCSIVHTPVLARILCSLLTKSAMYCLLTVREEPACIALHVKYLHRTKHGSLPSKHARLTCWHNPAKDHYAHDSSQKV